MLIPEVHPLGARVLVLQDDGLPPYESQVNYVIGDGTRLDKNAEWYRVEDSRCPEEGLPAGRVRRIVRVDMPSGDTFEGVHEGDVRDMVGYDWDDPNATITQYSVRYLYAPEVHELVDTAWVTPL